MVPHRPGVLHAAIRLVSTVCQQPVIAYPDAEHAGDTVEDDSGGDRSSSIKNTAATAPMWKALIATVVRTLYPF